MAFNGMEVHMHRRAHSLPRRRSQLLSELIFVLDVTRLPFLWYIYILFRYFSFHVSLSYALSNFFILRRFFLSIAWYYFLQTLLCFYFGIDIENSMEFNPVWLWHHSECNLFCGELLPLVSLLICIIREKQCPLVSQSMFVIVCNLIYALKAFLFSRTIKISHSVQYKSNMWALPKM